MVMMMVMWQTLTRSRLPASSVKRSDVLVRVRGRGRVRDFLCMRGFVQFEVCVCGRRGFKFEGGSSVEGFEVLLVTRTRLGRINGCGRKRKEEEGVCVRGNSGRRLERRGGEERE